METLKESDNVKLEFVISQELNLKIYTKMDPGLKEGRFLKSCKDENKDQDQVVRNCKNDRKPMRDVRCSKPHSDSVLKTDHLDNENTYTKKEYDNMDSSVSSRILRRLSMNRNRLTNIENGLVAAKGRRKGREDGLGIWGQ